MGDTYRIEYWGCHWHVMKGATPINSFTSWREAKACADFHNNLEANND